MRPGAIVITGMGAISALGDGVPALWRGIAAATPGTTPYHGVFADRFAAQIPAARWAELLGPDPEVDRALPLAVAAAREALARAGLPPERRGRRLALALGTSAAGMTLRARYEATPQHQTATRRHLLAEARPHAVAGHLAAALGLSGPAIVVATACTSSTIALGQAMLLLAAGHADAVLAGGVDALEPELVAGFAAVGAMGHAPCQPFGDPPGMCLGEGAGFVVLERAAEAEGRGARALAVLRGFGSASDGYHPTAPDPTGSGTRRASAMALAHAGLAPKDVDHYDAHGSGTEEGDAAEWQGVVALLGERANELSVSASKGQIGHCLGAAGILELIAVVEARRRGLVPPSLRPPELRPSTPPRLVVDHPSSQVVQHSLCHNAAFGGNYASLVVSAANEVGAKPTRDGGAVILAGAFARSGHPEAPEAWRSPTDADGHLRLGPPPQRGLDHLGQLLLVATRGALASAGARLRARPDPEATAGSLLRERVGLFVGATHASQSALADFWSRIHRLGLDQVSGRSFARLTINAPAGALSRASELFGPFCVIAEGPGSGLKAAALARETLRRSDDVDAIVVAAAFERGPPGEAEDEDLAETTAAVVLARAEVLASPRRPVIDEVVFGGPGCGPPRRNGRLFAADSIAAGGHSEAADLLALVAAADFAQQCGERARASAYNPATGWSAISLRPPTDG